MSRTGTAHRPRDNSADDLGSIFAVLTTRVSGTNSISIRYYSHLIPAFGLCSSRRRGVRILARPISSCLHHHENRSREVRLSTVLLGTRPDLAAQNKGRDGRYCPLLGKEVYGWPTGGESVVNQRHDGGRVVEIGAIDNIGVQLDASYGLLLNLFPNLPADAERRPLKQRKARRGKRARA